MKRYQLVLKGDTGLFELDEHPEGNWVHFKDHEAEIARIQALDTAERRYHATALDRQDGEGRREVGRQAARGMTAAQLQRLLDKMGETQVGMAKRLGISDRNMRRYVSGELPVPRVMVLAVRCLAEHKEPK